jgi:menaquinone-9 beta-reductase
MSDIKQYDVTIIGGGLAGLALSIQLSRLGYSVALFEKETYPFHKVCGEYISMESWNFLESLGLPLPEMNLPIIKKLMVSSPNGAVLHAALPFGGFGISRYRIDNDLKNIAVANKVSVYEKCKVNELTFADGVFTLQSSLGDFYSKICCGSFGKRSNLDIKWKRDFIHHKNNKLSNYVGIKYHIKTSFAPDTIALHNFKDGYCGISKIEEDKFCLCYLTNASNLSDNNNSVQELEQNILKKNKHLKNILENSELLFKAPVTISQISFNKKTQVHEHVLLMGDAAGMITPLCGNGMSMALHGSKIAAAFVNDFLKGKINREQMEINYTKEWKKIFSTRLFTGRVVQQLFGKPWGTNIFIQVMKLMPFVTRQIIRLTHGKPF